MEIKKTQVQVINDELNQQLADPRTVGALLATTFKGLTAVLMKQALMEGMLRGFTFKDFLEKNLYAIPFGQGYSLITSIDYARKKGMRGGINGKSKPRYADDANGNVKSCEITVFKKDGHPDGYTAEVYFSEYSTGKNQWQTKPRTMIAKVAEMHALRMACPEELEKMYVEEEMQKEDRMIRDIEEKVDESKLTMGSILKTNGEKNENQDEARVAESVQDGHDEEGAYIE